MLCLAEQDTMLDSGAGNLDMAHRCKEVDSSLGFVRDGAKAWHWVTESAGRDIGSERS